MIRSIDDHASRANEIHFPKIPEWDRKRTVQVVSPVDNPKQEGGYGQTNCHLGRITRIFQRRPKLKGDTNVPEMSEQPEREVIWLGGIMHRGPFAMIDFYHTCNERYGAFFTYFDNPKTTYDLDILSDQVINYLEQRLSQCTKEEFVICAASAWEVLARRVYEKLLERQRYDILSRIVHHFSICGVSTYDELSLPQKMLINTTRYAAGRRLLEWILNNIPTRINSLLWETPITKIIGDTFFAPVNDQNSARLESAWNQRHNTWSTSAWQHLNRRHRKRWALGTTPAHYDIFESLQKTRDIPSRRVDIPSTIMYSDDDPTFSDPKRNSEQDAKFYTLVTICPVKQWGHVDVVFQSEKYLYPITSELDKTWAVTEEN